MRKALSFAVIAIFAISLVSFAGTKDQKTVKINVKGMTCGACVNKVQTALNKVEGVENAKVELTENRATIVYNAKKTNEKALYKAINATGFKAIDKKAGKMKMKGTKACGAECPGKCCADKKDKAI